MVNAKELCKLLLKNRYDIDTDGLKTVSTYRPVYDFILRNKGILGLSINTLDEVLENLNKLLDYIEDDNLEALLSIEGISEQDIERVRKARNKMEVTMNSAIRSICNKIN